MEEINSLKTQGNQLFQQKNFEQAIQVYTQATNAIEKIVGAFNLNEEEQVQLLTLRLAVILNRALAYIELKNIDQIGLAEVDCTHALELQPGSIKALYRRALARELMGKIREAQVDVRMIQQIEPTNPAAWELSQRLYMKEQEIRLAEKAALAEKKEKLASANTQVSTTDLIKEMRDFSITDNNQSSKQFSSTFNKKALSVWDSLQKEEIHLRKVYQRKKPCKSTEKKNKNKPVQTGLLNSRKKEDISLKTDSIWESLLQEENQMKQVFKRKTTRPAATSTLKN